MNRKAGRMLFGAVVLIAALMVSGWFNIWRSPHFAAMPQDCADDDRILSMVEYGELGGHDRPFVVTLPDLVVFGAEHTRNPEDAQLESIRTMWDSLQPTVALVEGRLGFLIPYAMNPVEQFGEGGFVAELARKDGAALYTWDLPKSELVTQMLKTYSPEQVALQLILTPYFSNYRFGRPDDPEQFVSGYLNRAGYPGLENCIASVEDIDRIWHRDFAGFADWRETSDQFGLPGYLDDMSATANMIRNQHLRCVIDNLRARGQRVFVICGSSHVVCLAPSLPPQEE